MDDKTFQSLIRDLQNGDGWRRRAATQKLGDSKYPAAVSALIAVYNDADPVVKQNVVDGLKKLATPEAMDFLNSIPRPRKPLERSTITAASELVKREYLAGKDEITILNMLKEKKLSSADSQKIYLDVLNELERQNKPTEKAKDSLIGFLGWWVINALAWSIVTAGVSIDGWLEYFCLIPAIYIGNIVALIRLVSRRQWIVIGMISAVVLNILIVIVMGANSNGNPLVPFFIEFPGWLR